MEILFLKTTRVPIAKKIDEISRSNWSEPVILHWTVSVYVTRFIVGKIVSSKIERIKIVYSIEYRENAIYAILNTNRFVVDLTTWNFILP